MAERKHQPGASSSAATVPSLPSAHAKAFAEAQERLAARRRARAAADAEARAQAAAAAAAQRAASTAALRARLGLNSGSSSSGSSGDPPALAQRLGATALAAWERVGRWGSAAETSIGAGPRPQPAFRVSQVDAELLDEELLELLRGQVADALRYVRDGAVAEDWSAEIGLGLRAALFKLTVWDHDATYGAALQNLRFADARAGAGAGGVPAAPARWQKAVYGLVTVGGRYAWTKWEEYLRDRGGGDDEDEEEEEEEQEDTQAEDDATSLPQRLLRHLRHARPPRLSPLAVRRLARATTVVSDVYAGAAFVSFLLFLRHGRYRTLLDRVLRMRLVPPTSQVHREVSFEYLNRQLVWHAFTEFLLFLLPLVGVQRWRRWLARTWRRTARTARSVSTAVAAAVGRGSDAGAEGSPETTTAGPLAFLPERTCAICYEDQTAATTEADLLAQAAASSGVIGSADTDVTNPYEAVPCGCVYCYVCLATRVEREAGDGWPCLRCGAVVTACRPWRGDVLEPVVPGVAASSSAAAAGTAESPGAGGDSEGASRPSSSSTTASGGHPHKTVGFADDVKGDDETTTTDDDGIVMNEVDGEDEGEDEDVDEDVDENDVDDDDDNYSDGADSDSEAYEEEEDGVDVLE